MDEHKSLHLYFRKKNLTYKWLFGSDKFVFLQHDATCHTWKATKSDLTTSIIRFKHYRKYVKRNGEHSLCKWKAILMHCRSWWDYLQFLGSYPQVIDPNFVRSWRIIWLSVSKTNMATLLIKIVYLQTYNYVYLKICNKFSSLIFSIFVYFIIISKTV